MKKNVFLVLMSVLVCAGFAACGSDDSKDPLGGEEDVKTPKPLPLTQEIKGIRIVDAVYNTNFYAMRFYSVPYDNRYDYPYYRIGVSNYDRFDHMKSGDFRVRSFIIHKVIGDNNSGYIYEWSVEIDGDSEYKVKESHVSITGSTDPEWFSVKADITRLLDATGGYIDNYPLRYEGKIKEVYMLTY